MRFTSTALIALVVLTPLVAAQLGGCSSDSDDPAGGSCQDYSPPAEFNATAPVVTFSNDVMPIIQRSCAFANCHGNDRNGIAFTADPATIRQSLERRASKLPTMPYVTPGNPRESFLQRKIDGSQCALNAQCTNGDCGATMPRNNEMLTLEERDVFRRWIAQGAKAD